jgi:ABC-2 type transport system permease protein
MNLSTFLKLELKNFLSGKTVFIAVLCLLLASCYAMFYGKNTIDKQQAIIGEIPSFQAEHFKKQLELNKDDFGNLLYYLQHSTVHQASSWAAFSIGQRDVNPYNIKVKMLTLEGQIYDSEMSNPTNLLYGNFDLAFVIVFLLPLLIVAFCHNLISADQENGIWNLLSSQPVSAAKIIGWRLLIRFVIVLILAFSVITASCFYQSSAFDIRFIYALLITFSYLTFWFALTAFVISFQKSSTYNALSLLGVWIFLTILAPALLNLLISTALPVSESFEVTVKQREGYHNKWDKSKAETMQKFYEIYPEYKNFPIPEDKFSWGWYYAMNLMGDIEAANSTDKYIEKLQKRDKLTNQVALFLPTINTQLSYNSLAKNDLQSHLEYLESVRNYHQNIREFYYPSIFRNSKVVEINWTNVPKHEFNDETTKIEFPMATFGRLAFILFLSTISWLNFRYKHKIRNRRRIQFLTTDAHR